MATAYKLASFIPDISTYPFSLAWSEASRYYYASLWLSKQVYGQLIPPSVLHPSRYLLQAIPVPVSGFFALVQPLLAGDSMGEHCLPDQLVIGPQAAHPGSKQTTGHNPEHGFLGIPVPISRTRLLPPAFDGDTDLMGF